MYGSSSFPPELLATASLGPPPLGPPPGPPPPGAPPPPTAAPRTVPQAGPPNGTPAGPRAGAKKSSRRGADAPSQKRRCISTACIACCKRKSKCDGALPSCAACASVYGTDCIYDPNSDHRRKGVYRERGDGIKARNSTLQMIVEALLNASEDNVPDVFRTIRAGDNLDAVAQKLAAAAPAGGRAVDPGSPGDDDAAGASAAPDQGESELARRMGGLRLDNGSVRFIGGISHLVYLDNPIDGSPADLALRPLPPSDDPVTSWSRVTTDAHLVTHLIDMYFTYHYTCFTTLSKKLFWRDFAKGAAGVSGDASAHCSPLLVNAMLAVGCHFTDFAGAYAVSGDSRTKGDHFFAEAKRLIMANDEFAKPHLVTVQALALMSVREAGCAREANGWVYSGMSFRMAQDLGLNLEVHGKSKRLMSDEEIDARKVTFWGCFLFDKCWSNYLGRLPQLPKSGSNVSRLDVFPDEDAETWCPLTDKGRGGSHQQPSRTRASALLLSGLCEISSDLLIFFYHPNHIGRSRGKSAELRMLGEIHQRLEEWRRQMPREFEPCEGQLPNVILMHMFFHLQYIHLFRPFLKYAPGASPLPGHVSPRRICTANAGAISKLTRLYKKAYNLRQVCNIAVYMIHSACTIHLLNLPDKSARRDITHGVKHLEMAGDWPCARRTLGMLSTLARKWRCELPEAVITLERTDKYGQWGAGDTPSPSSSAPSLPATSGEGAAKAGGGGRSSPLSHYTQVHMTQFTPPTASLDSQVPMMPLALQMMGGGPRLGPQHHPELGFDGGRADLNADMLGGWAQASTSVPEAHYGSPLLAVNGGGVMGEGSSSQAASRQVSPAQGLAFESQRWVLGDGARWQQNFDGWGMVGSMAAEPVFAFGGGERSEGTRAESGDDGRGAMEGLAAPLGEKGWMAGLE